MGVDSPESDPGRHAGGRTQRRIDKKNGEHRSVRDLRRKFRKKLMLDANRHIGGESTGAIGQPPRQKRPRSVVPPKRVPVSDDEDGQRSSGRKPVLLATRASIRGPISSSS